MKKSISTILILFVALISMSASAQSSRLIGSWIGESMPIPGYNGKMIPVYVFKNSGAGAIAIGMSFDNLPIDQGASIDAEIIVSISFTWEYRNNTLRYYLNKNSYDIEVSEISINTTDYQLRREFKKMKPQLKNMLVGYIKESAIPNLPSRAKLTNVSFRNNKMYAYDGDTRMVFTRSNY